MYQAGVTPGVTPSPALHVASQLLLPCKLFSQIILMWWPNCLMTAWIYDWGALLRFTAWIHHLSLSGALQSILLIDCNVFFVQCTLFQQTVIFADYTLQYGTVVSVCSVIHCSTACISYANKTKTPTWSFLCLFLCSEYCNVHAAVYTIPPLTTLLQDWTRSLNEECVHLLGCTGQGATHLTLIVTEKGITHVMEQSEQEEFCLDNSELFINSSVGSLEKQLTILGSQSTVICQEFLRFICE